MAKASITMETWRCHPCQDLLSLWSSPNSFFAVSKLSSIAHRWPSTATSVSVGVPAGHQVVKKARSRRYFDGSADLASKDRDLRYKILRPRDRPIRDNTNHAAAVLWFRPPADRRFQSDGRRVRAMSAALPATDR